MQNLNQEYWNNRYINNETGWDIGKASTPLKLFIETFENKNVKILIPGCGNAHEIECLLENGFTNITVIDISEIAVNSIKNRFNNAIAEEKLNVIFGDFFEHKGNYDLILEQTFFCAINPNLRNNYALKMHEFLSNNGIVVGVLFNCNFEKEGPPFGGNEEEYRKLFQSNFKIKKMELCYNSIPPRSGNELFFILSKS
jgi:SAM-dependent methyltransferase